MAEYLNPARMLAVEDALNDLRDTMGDPAVTGRPFPVYIPNRLILGSPVTSPVVATASGSVTEVRQYAYNFESSEGDYQTKISGATGVELASAKAWIQGDRSTDTRVDLVNIFTRVSGGTSESYRRVTQFANPASGSWNYTDNAGYSTYLGNPPPCQFAYPLQIASAVNFRVRRIRLQASRALAADSSAYWIFWMEVRKNLASLPYLTLGKQDTKKVGLQGNTIYEIPMWHLRGEAPNRDLDLALGEDDRVYFMSRGVGAVSPLPNLLAMVEVSREAT